MFCVNFSSARISRYKHTHCTNSICGDLFAAASAGVEVREALSEADAIKRGIRRGGSPRCAFGYFSLFPLSLCTCLIQGYLKLLFCLPRKVTKRVHSRTTFLRISLTCRFKRAAARVQNGMLLHLTWYALTNRKVVSFDTDNMVL